MVISILIILIIVVTTIYVKKTKAAPIQQQLTEVESLKLENNLYKQQLLRLEGDQIIDSICKAHSFDKCTVDFQTKSVTKKDK